MRFALALHCVGALLTIGTVHARETLRYALPDTAGVLHTETDLRNKAAVAFVFISTDCPISNSYLPELNRLYRTYAGQGVALFAVHSDPTQTADEVRRYAKEYGYTFPVLLDHKQLLARFTGATVTPEVALLSKGGTLLYRGRIDDKYPAIGTTRLVPTEFNLRNALAAAVSGQAVTPNRTVPVGCAIPFLSEVQK
jgi:peroxiredoxin